jgi:hypothetical protein
VTTGWMFGPTRLLERGLCLVAALLLLYLEPLSIALGAGALTLAVVVHLVMRAAHRAPTPSPDTDNEGAQR